MNPRYVLAITGVSHNIYSSVSVRNVAHLSVNAQGGCLRKLNDLARAVALPAFAVPDDPVPHLRDIPGHLADIPCQTIGVSSVSQIRSREICPPRRIPRNAGGDAFHFHRIQGWVAL